LRFNYRSQMSQLTVTHPSLPKFLACRDVESAQLVVARRGNEHQSARGDDRTAEIR
jgi:hypothetical protein